MPAPWPWGAVDSNAAASSGLRGSSALALLGAAAPPQAFVAHVFAYAHSVPPSDCRGRVQPDDQNHACGPA
eukprot:5139222-Pyramimonas_sp.AAC.1